jgi:hypothetical protein
VNDFHPKMDLVLDKEAFIYVLTHSPCFSLGAPLSMVESFWGIVLSLTTLLVALIFF